MYQHQHSLTFYHDHLLPIVHFPLLPSLFRSPFSVYNLSPLFACRAPAPGMAPNPSGPPGLPRPKKSSPLPDSDPPNIFSPAPSKPRTSWFQLLSSPSPSPVPFVTPAIAVSSTEKACPKPHVALVQDVHQDAGPNASIVTKNNELIINLATTASAAPLSTGLATSDPWTRAHVRVCAHATEECAACSIALVCCSCCAL